MRKSDIVRAWKDEDYRMSLSDAEQRMLPTNPAGLIEISDNELGAVAGGDLAHPAGSFQVICSWIGGCNSDFYQICSGDFAPCTGGQYLCPSDPLVFD
jgi:mersacidin/lichenicidin family type 2 lantibiotic